MGRESIKALIEILYCHLIVLLVVWLALFAPVMCQYHGLMIHFGAEPADHAQMADMASSSPQAGLRFHQMASSVTMVMSLFVAAMPGGTPVLAPNGFHRFSRDDANPRLQRALPVPEQPPRQRLS